MKITSSTSVLVVEGEVALENLELDERWWWCAGAKVTIKGLKVRNEVDLRARERRDEVDALRGFVVQKNETETLVFDQPGEYVVP